MSDLQCAFDVIDKEVDTILKIKNLLNVSFYIILDLLEKCKGRVIITGMGKSGHIGQKIAATLASTGTPSFFVHPAEASHGDLGMITNEDIVIAISNSGESKELIDILNYCKRYNICLIGITKNKESSLGKACNHILELPNTGEACPLNLAPTNSTTATLVIGDILACCLMNRKGFTKDDFNNRHPGGKLGTILQRVKDIMHTGNSLPLLSLDANMTDVILEMSSKRLGCVGLTDEDGCLVGIITDGDLRRCLSEKILQRKAFEVMTTNPKTLTSDIMVSEATRIMNENKITNMFIIENNKPIGIIHIHDILSEGVI